MLTTLFVALSSVFKTRAALQLENVALRHQLVVLRRSVKKPKLTPLDRLLWAWLSGVWADWRCALIVVKPETVIAWHRKGFRLFWTWKVRHGQPGRPSVLNDVRDLIRLMSRANPTWGAPRIHGELLKLGIDIGETSVSKYGPSPEAAIADLAHFFGESREEPGIGGLLHCSDSPLPSPLRIFGVGS